MYSLNERDVETGPSTLVSGQLSISNLNFYVLIDSGATHLVIAKRLVDRIDGNRRTVNNPFITVTLTGDVYQSTFWFKDVPIRIGEFSLFANLIEIEMYNFDVILGMDWLTAHYAIIDCRKKHVCFSPPNVFSFEFQGTPRGWSILTIFALQAKKLIDSGCRGYLANIVDTTKERESVPSDVPIV